MFFYVIRDIRINTKIVKIFKKFVSTQNIIEHLNLNKKLNFDVLFTFRNNFSNKLFSKRFQNYEIKTNNVKFVNQSSYKFFKKQLNEQMIQINYFIKKIYTIKYIVLKCFCFLCQKK